MTFSRKQLIGLKADDFRHPFDQESTLALKQVPGLDVAIRSLLGSVAEQFFYLNNIAASVLVSDQQLPDLHRLLLDACAILDLDPPQVYIQQNPVPNAYTFAMRGKQPFMVIHTSLLDMLTPAEVQAVMAHELGHLKCEHGVYLTMANLMVLAAGLFPTWGTVVAESLRTRMLEWLRCAEFSCDRAALLATQDPKIVMSVLMKLSGGSPKLSSQLNLNAFIDQARAYESISESQLGDLLKIAQAQQLTHPVPVLRAKEIDRWASSPDYHQLIKSSPSGYNLKSDHKGKWRNW